jgi:predicted CXXCH cytochrome family protein
MNAHKILATLLLCTLATPALALEIVSPANEAIVAQSAYLVIKGGDNPPIDAIDININGEKSGLLDISAADYRKTFGDFVFLEADFDPGVNQVEVEGYSGGKRVTAVKIKVYLPDSVIEPPAPYALKPFHTAANEALCAGCHHQMDPTPKDLANPVPGQNPCSTCHETVLNARHVHGPAGVYDCSACHDVKSTPYKYTVADTEGRFCLDCHDSMVTDLRKRPYIHGPVAAGLCLTCHDPHASDAPGLVRGPTVNVSCSGCHERVEKEVHAVRAVAAGGHKLEGPRDPAQPGKPFHCASCHDPHSGAIATLLRYEATSSMTLCRQCHKK